MSRLINSINQFAPDKITEGDLLCSPIKTDINWLEHSYQQFPPFAVGKFFIFGSHYDGEKPADKIPLQIDAATAFGSGEHGTTKGCLEALTHTLACAIAKAVITPGAAMPPRTHPQIFS